MRVALPCAVLIALSRDGGSTHGLYRTALMPSHTGELAAGTHAASGLLTPARLSVCPETRIAVVCHWGFISALMDATGCEEQLSLHNCTVFRAWSQLFLLMDCSGCGQFGRTSGHCSTSAQASQSQFIRQATEEVAAG